MGEISRPVTGTPFTHHDAAAAVSAAATASLAALVARQMTRSENGTLLGFVPAQHA